MKKVKIALLSTAMLIGMNQLANANYTQEQIDTLFELSEADNTAGLISYINANPSLLQGDDALARSLQEFIRRTSTPLGRLFGPVAPDLSMVRGSDDDAVVTSEANFGSLGTDGS